MAELNEKILELISYCRQETLNLERTDRFDQGYKQAMENVLDEIKEAFPKEWEHYEEENYDGPNDPYAGAINY